MSRTEANDAKTLAFYDQEAAIYVQRSQVSPGLAGFLNLLRPGAAILELGCGGGHDAEAMLARGFDVQASDGSPAMALQAERRLGRPVAVLRFDQLSAEAAFDGVWANASLLHVKADALAGIFGRIHRALRPGGLFFANFKAGDGEARDTLGRYYNFPSETVLRTAFTASGPWETLDIRQAAGGGYDGVARTWLNCLATKARD